MSRTQHDQLVRQGMVPQGQMPIRMLRAPGAHQQRPLFPRQGQPANRYSTRYLSVWTVCEKAKDERKMCIE